MADPKYLRITWNAFHEDAKLLASKIDVSKYNKIYAISRGGLAPACILSYELNIRDVDSIEVVGYDAQTQQKEIRLLKDICDDGEGAIVVDDLVDSGRTIEFLRKKMPKALFVTVYAKPKRKELVDFYAIDLPVDEWVMFPWENDVHPDERFIKVRDVK